MSVTFVPVETESQIEDLAQLAGEIWREYWPDRIGEAQTEYMVEQFQSLPAIQKGVAEQGYRYWFVVDDELTANDTQGEARYGAADWAPIVGYTGGYTEAETNRFFISKIYLIAGTRGKGYCSKTIAFYDKLCAAEGLSAMYLTVNKYNEMGTRAYLAKGFEIIESTEADIGGGFVMDDYIMEKKAAK